MPAAAKLVALMSRHESQRAICYRLMAPQGIFFPLPLVGVVET